MEKKHKIILIVCFVILLLSLIASWAIYVSLLIILLLFTYNLRKNKLKENNREAPCVNIYKEISVKETKFCYIVKYRQEEILPRYFLTIHELALEINIFCRFIIDITKEDPLSPKPMLCIRRKGTEDIFPDSCTGLSKKEEEEFWGKFNKNILQDQDIKN